MSTKQNPGNYDCYAKLADDEPYFVLRAKDPHAPVLVELWAALREAQFGSFGKLEEARSCAQQMRGWFRRTGQKKLSERTLRPSEPESGNLRFLLSLRKRLQALIERDGYLISNSKLDALMVEFEAELKDAKGRE